MDELIVFLKNKFPNSEVFKSCDKNYICVRTKLGESKFMKPLDNGKLEPFLISISNTEKFHLDSVKLMMLLKND